MKYFIEHNQYFNELGIPSDPYFRVYHMKRFLGLISYKKYSTETTCGIGDCYNTPINFKSEKVAKKFIKNILCLGIKTENTKITTIKEISCE